MPLPCDRFSTLLQWRNAMARHCNFIGENSAATLTTNATWRTNAPQLTNFWNRR